MVIGTLLASRYRIEGFLGRGGMGSIWLARDTDTHHEVVVKVVCREIASHPTAVTRFIREMRVLTLMQSPHIVKVLDRGVDIEVGPFLVMEKLEGEDLEKLVKKSGPLSPKMIETLAHDIGSALEHIHSHGLVHRDLKPSNVFLCHKLDGSSEMKLLDFGAVKANVPLRADGGRTSPGMLVGTLTRMSPEQLQGECVDFHTDIWAFALLVFEVLVGNPVIPPDSSMGETVLRICGADLPVPSRENPSLPKSFDDWFARSTQKAPQDRFASIQEQCEALITVCRQWQRDRLTTSHVRRRLPVTVEQNPLIIQVEGPLKTFPPLVSRQKSELVEKLELPPLVIPIRQANPVETRSTWPAPGSHRSLRVPDVEKEPGLEGFTTLFPPRNWPATG